MTLHIFDLQEHHTRTVMTKTTVTNHIPNPNKYNNEKILSIKSVHNKE